MPTEPPKYVVGVDLGGADQHTSIAVMRRDASGVITVVSEQQMPPRKPWCAQCQRPVASITALRDPHTCKVKWIVRCHGAMESAEVTDEEFEQMTSGTLRLGEAFKGHSAPTSLK